MGNLIHRKNSLFFFELLQKNVIDFSQAEIEQSPGRRSSQSIIVNLYFFHFEIFFLFELGLVKANKKNISNTLYSLNMDKHPNTDKFK